MNSNEWTSLSVRQETYQQVKAAKQGGETFDELLQRLIESETSGT